MAAGRKIKKRMFRERKAQAAMEYVHTYGWIILSVVVLGGVMMYYNVSKVQQILPLECEFLSGLSCLDADVEGTQLSLVVVNGFGFALSNVSINLTGTCNSTANTTPGNPYGNLNVLLENKQAVYVFDCPNLTNMKVQETISVGYWNVETGKQHIKIGKLYYSPTGG
jgi:hypothetical protein